ncbi:hypothetical protein DWY36_18910 [Firmicutes bacterium AF25-13AC]|nr:hypothetical protein DWY36_18910 [Firmicutes bacterium AF25-13AC]
MLQNPYKTAETILFASSKPRGKLKSVDLYGPSVKEKNEVHYVQHFILKMKVVRETLLPIRYFQVWN